MNNTAPTPRLSVWLLMDDRAGNRSQVLGVGRALGLPFIIKELQYTAAAALPNYMLMASFSAVTQKARVNLMAPWPDVVIAAGRRTAPVARKIKALSGGKAFLVQIMHPGASGEREFDLIGVPRHDNMAAADNRFMMTGAPHGATPEALAAAAGEWQGRFDALPRPWVALIVGGDTRRKVFKPEYAEALGRMAEQLTADAGGSLLVTTSRRTSPQAAHTLLASCADVPRHVFQWGEAPNAAGENPYMAYLAMADHIIVTGDSVSMCCEACATDKPVYIYAPKKITVHKHGELHKNLYAEGYARPLENAERLSDWTHRPLNAAYDVAAEIKNRLGLA